jgi:hypothetical protein
LFTVIFMTTIATLVKRFALWKAQKGAKVTDLEQYQASTSLPSTLKMIFLLRAFHWMSILLVFTWSWYYLGSQAVSREYTFKVSPSYHDSRVFFQTTEAPSSFQSSTGLISSDIATINSIYNVNYGNLRVGASDLYGAAVIPMINQTSDSGFGAFEKGGWRAIPTSSSASSKAGTALVFSSYAGVPTYWASEQSAGPGWIGTYRMNASYLFANCSDPVIHAISEFPAGVLPTLPTSFNISNETTNGFNTFDVWNRISNSSIHSSCLLETHYVELQSSCDAKACAFQKIRPTKGKAFPSPSTPFSNLTVAQRFFSELMLSDGIPSNQSTTGPNIFFSSGLTYSSEKWDGAYASQSMAQSLSTGTTQMINTYMAASQPQYSLYGLDFDFMVGLVNGTIHNATWPTGPAHGAMYNPAYVLSIPWIVIDLITCTILLFAAIASFWLRTRTEAPDIFGYVSTMYTEMQLPQGSNTMSGVERARAMKGVRVKIADLGGEGSSTRVGLAEASRTLRKESA